MTLQSLFSSDDDDEVQSALSSSSIKRQRQNNKTGNENIHRFNNRYSSIVSTLEISVSRKREIKEYIRDKKILSLSLLV